jgi:hypothetical protein
MSAFRPCPEQLAANWASVPCRLAAPADRLSPDNPRGLAERTLPKGQSGCAMASAEPTQHSGRDNRSVSADTQAVSPRVLRGAWAVAPKGVDDDLSDRPQ